MPVPAPVVRWLVVMVPARGRPGMCVRACGPQLGAQLARAPRADARYKARANRSFADVLQAVSW